MEVRAWEIHSIVTLPRKKEIITMTEDYSHVFLKFRSFLSPRADYLNVVPRSNVESYNKLPPFPLLLILTSLRIQILWSYSTNQKSKCRVTSPPHIILCHFYFQNILRMVVSSEEQKVANILFPIEMFERDQILISKF